jgi:penicillin-binding protein 1A
LGNHAYGVGAAAEIYYNKTVDELDLAEIATIAGLPKAPSTFNPIVNPGRALTRRDYVLDRMLALGFITNEEYTLALAAPEHRGLTQPLDGCRYALHWRDRSQPDVRAIW